MAKIVKRNKPLSVMPLKSSQPVGASLAFLGINRTIPMMHGSQGCTAFGKVYFVRHFREPIPLQTTAMDQVSSVMGADDNVVQGLKTICEKSKPALIGLPTTGLSETQGTDIKGAVRLFREKYPQYDPVKVVPVNTPDFTGSMESGYAAAVAAMVDELVPNAESAGTKPGARLRQVNVLVSAMLTPGDIEELKEIIVSFGLRPVVIPDISDSLDGHLTDRYFDPLTVGGTPVSEFVTLGDALATLVIGASLNKAADILKKRTGVPDYRFPSLLGMEAVDQLIMALIDISGNPVPERIERQRAQLEDAMVDTHFMIGQARVAIASDPDLLFSFSTFLASMGAEVVAAVTTANAPQLKEVPSEEVKIGDLEDLEHLASQNRAQLIIGNSHCAQVATRLGTSMVYMGFPLYDVIGGYQKTWVGYRGARLALFDLANLLLASGCHDIKPYRSIYSSRPEDQYYKEALNERIAALKAGSTH
jgi:nitrogenase molybdenum-iron protein NifN